MKSISGYICKPGFQLAMMLVLSPVLWGQDTLRTYGPRIGADLSRFAYYFVDPPEIGAEASLDMEVYSNIYPVFEMGYSRMSQEGELFDYSSGGPYFRVGADYNLLPIRDRSVHHIMTVGGRYAYSPFLHRAENVVVPSSYWGEMVISSYENTLHGHWLELVGGIKTELAPNFFLGWMVRYRILLNQEMDPLVTPHMVPGYGTVNSNRGFGVTYSILYKIPLIKR
jgi:hypothetical protein